MILGILGLFLKVLPRPILDYVAIKAESANEALSIRAKNEQHRREVQRDIIVAEQGWWLTAMIRPLLAFPVIIYFWKIIVWDKVLGWGVTDPLAGAAAEWAGLIVGAYVVGRSAEKVARIVKR